MEAPQPPHRTDRSLEGHRRDWEALAEVDPLWAILTTRERRGNRWDPEAFFRTGEQEAATVIARMRALGRPRRRDALLDFGCGVGRLTRAFAPHFASCVGVDIAGPMIAKARALNADVINCRFELNPAPDLALFGDGAFDMVFSTLVLQHLPDRAGIGRYIAEFVRVLRPGGLVAFQLPCHIARRHRLRPRRHAYRLLRGLGLPDRFLHHRLNLTPMRETFVPVEQVCGWLAACAAEVLAVDRRPTPGLESATYWVTVDR